MADSSVALTVAQNQYSLLFADTSSVKEAVTILRGTSDITDYVTINDMKSARVDNILVVYELYASIRTQEQNEEWDKDYYTSVTIVPNTPIQFVIGQ